MADHANHVGPPIKRLVSLRRDDFANTPDFIVGRHQVAGNRQVLMGMRNKRILLHRLIAASDMTALQNETSSPKKSRNNAAEVSTSEHISDNERQDDSANYS